jgi:hypothetical protein
MYEGIMVSRSDEEIHEKHVRIASVQNHPYVVNTDIRSATDQRL